MALLLKAVVAAQIVLVLAQVLAAVVQGVPEQNKKRRR